MYTLWPNLINSFYVIINISLFSSTASNFHETAKYLESYLCVVNVYQIITNISCSEAKLDEKDSPFLPPITPKKKQITSKSFVVSKEIATQITADALVPQQALGDYWVNKDTIINRSDPYADVALRVSRYFN